MVHVPLLKNKIDCQNKFLTKSCIIIEHCWSIVTIVLFVTVQVYIRDCTMVNMYPLLLFGGGSISVDLEKGNFVLTIDDGWIRFLADSTKVCFCCIFFSTTCKWNSMQLTRQTPCLTSLVHELHSFALILNIKCQKVIKFLHVIKNWIKVKHLVQWIQ